MRAPVRVYYERRVLRRMRQRLPVGIGSGGLVDAMVESIGGELAKLCTAEARAQWARRLRVREATVSPLLRQLHADAAAVRELREGYAQVSAAWREYMP